MPLQVSIASTISFGPLRSRFDALHIDPDVESGGTKTIGKHQGLPGVFARI